MNDLVAHVAARVDERRIAVALSGGIDSVVLLHSLVRAGADVCAVHVDHGLRRTSADDAHFTRNLASNLAVHFRCAKLEIAAGNSTQGRARIQRYAALVRAATALGARVIATGHHADDAVESCFLQAMRGAGVVGRAGPMAKTDWYGFGVIRPLLEVDRDTIEQFAQSNGIEWREDPTNAKTAYARNQLRHEILPDIDRSAARALMPRIRAEAARFEQDVDLLRRELTVAKTPTSWTARRSDRPGPTRSLRTVRAGVLLNVVEQLGGALNGQLLGDVLDALEDEETEARRYCGARVVVEVSRDFVVVEATRGQGTRLLDARKTPVVPLMPGATIPWFGHRLSIAPTPLQLKEERQGSDRHGFDKKVFSRAILRGPLDGETNRGIKIADLLAEAGVPPSYRWNWPCIFFDEECLAVCGIAPDGEELEILLPEGRFSGIFEPSHLLSDTDSGTRTG